MFEHFLAIFLVKGKQQTFLLERPVEHVVVASQSSSIAYLAVIADHQIGIIRTANRYLHVTVNTVNNGAVRLEVVLTQNDMVVFVYRRGIETSVGNCLHHCFHIIPISGSAGNN